MTFGPASALTYAVVATDADVVRATFEDRLIAVELPAALARRFVDSDLVTIEHRQQIVPAGEALTILIEKDFVCLDREEDPDRVDAYPRPPGACG